MTKKQLSLVLTRKLKITDQVMGLKYSPDGKYIAASLLDQTIKVFFEDTFKFSISLYGHKMAVT